MICVAIAALHTQVPFLSNLFYIPLAGAKTSRNSRAIQDSCSNIYDYSYRPAASGSILEQGQCHRYELFAMTDRGGPSTAVVDDIAMRWDYLGAILDGDIKPQDIILMISLDGAQLYNSKESDLNFGSLSPQGSDSYVPSSPDLIENSRVLPLQNRAPGNMGPVEHIPYAPYPPQMGLSGPNQVSGLNLSCSGELIVL